MECGLFVKLEKSVTRLSPYQCEIQTIQTIEPIEEVTILLHPEGIHVMAETSDEVLMEGLMTVGIK